MDAIRNLVAGADPIGPDPIVPDAEEALGSMFSRPEVFADRVSPDIPTLAERRQRRGRVLGLMTIAAAAVTAGVLVSLNLGPLTSAPAPAGTSTPTPTAGSSVSPTPTATASSTPSASPAPTPAATLPVTPSEPASPPVADWRRFSSPSAGVSFEVPAGWTAKDVPAGAPDYPASGIEVSDEAGKTVATLYYGTGGGLGGACGPEKYTQIELDSAEYTAGWDPNAGVRFSYRLIDRTSVGGGFSYQAGLVDESSGRLTNSCLMYSVVHGVPRGTLYFADRAWNAPDEPVFQTMAEATAYMSTDEYRNLKKMILTLSLPG
ncbi:hypothetical protein QFZ40_002489 [Arthrobacter pascens]|uniref:hypothetical protein n=1 Tax=Arthrobacter pascens TaxID=1677 RepID=UPI00277D6029|nr:hypothetical protein [Arthrobacter pascens]MDQ0634580.1 hypothetical protein [Arthrobacter pascens]